MTMFGLEMDNERVLRFRFRTDAVTNRRLAEQLRRRADMLEAIGSVEDAPPVEAIEQALRLVESGTAGLDEWSKARIVRHIAVTGDSLWHAAWLMMPSPMGWPCDCAPCYRERNGEDGRLV